MRVATIDIGTNTVLLLIAERLGDGEVVAREERASITRLGQGVDKTHQLAPEAVARTNAVLDEYAQIIERHAVSSIDVVGTSAMRDAGGGDAVRDHVRRRLGVDARTITGEEEARITFAGALSGIRDIATGANVRVFDIGGGSTEIVHGQVGARDLVFAQSFDVGSVRLTERHIRSDPPTAGELDAIREAVRATLRDLPSFDSALPPVGIAGTVTTLAAISLGMDSYDASQIHGMRLSRAEIERVIRDLASIELEKRRAVVGLEPKRADVIIAGALIALGYLDHLGANSMVISDRGVRWGLALNLLSS